MTSLRILVAEDEAIIALLLGDVLRGLDHSICATVATEDEAVAAAATFAPDLIIIDAGLRDGSGLAAMARINVVRQTPHIYMTGNAAAIRSAEPKAIVLEKPFHEADLVAAIVRAIKSCTQTAQL